MVDFKNLAWATSFATQASRKVGKKVIVIPSNNKRKEKKEEEKTVVL